MAYATTVRLELPVKRALDKQKCFERESYSQVIARLVNISLGEQGLNEHEVHQIERSLEDIKRGKVLSLKDAEKEWGI